MGKLTDDEMKAARAFIMARDREANILGQMCIAFENQKARAIQQIESINRKEQEFMARLARSHGIDPNQTYGLNFQTAELLLKD